MDMAKKGNIRRETLIFSNCSIKQRHKDYVKAGTDKTQLIGGDPFGTV